MPALNMGLRQKIADMIAAGFEDKEIRKECPTAQSIIAPMHRIIELEMTAPLSPGQLARDAHYAAAMWLLTTDPAASLAILRVSHDTLPPCDHCEALLPVSSDARTLR